MMFCIIEYIIASYIITLIITSSSILEPIRNKIKSLTTNLQFGNNKHFVECRLCIGFWVTCCVCLYFNVMDNFFTIYGFSYFLATQERG